MENIDKEYEATIDYLHKWFQENPNLPREVDRLLLRRYYKCMYHNIDETKKLIEINYTLRNKYDYIFINRDPLDDDTLKTSEYADMILLPGLTPDNYKVSFYRIRDSDPAKVHFTEDNKAFFMVSDCRFCMPDVDDTTTVTSSSSSGTSIVQHTGTLADGEVQIFDLSGYSLKHLTKVNFTTLRIYMKFLQDAFPVRLKAIHLINCPSYLDRIVSVFKPFISSEVFKLIKFHTTGIETLYDYVPRAMLPMEYGGNAGNIDDLKAQIVNNLIQKRDYLIDPNHWKIETNPSATSRWVFF